MQSRFMKFILLAVAVAVLGAASAVATPVTWYLDNVTFTGGAVATGSFVYNANTNTYSSVNLSVTAGTLPANTFTNISIPTPIGFDTTNNNLTWALGFANPLTNAGGTIALTGGIEFTIPPSQNFQIASGFVTTVVPPPGDTSETPEPSTLALIPLGFVAMIAGKRFARSKATL